MFRFMRSGFNLTHFSYFSIQARKLKGYGICSSNPIKEKKVTKLIKFRIFKRLFMVYNLIIII